MARGWIHTVYRDGRWINEVEDGTVLSRHTTTEEAVRSGRLSAFVQTTEHVIHNVDGTISTRNSYGRDPFPPRG
jgi:hypothetical protein